MHRWIMMKISNISLVCLAVNLIPVSHLVIVYQSRNDADSSKQQFPLAREDGQEHGGRD